jgi:hypothetical protein
MEALFTVMASSLLGAPNRGGAPGLPTTSVDARTLDGRDQNPAAVYSALKYQALDVETVAEVVRFTL